MKGFDWDAANWPKCGKHGVSQAEIEAVFCNDPFVLADPFPAEARRRAIGNTDGGRWVFVVFVIRVREDGAYVRPVSARYMHTKEVEHFARQRET